jgi:serine protease Do
MFLLLLLFTARATSAAPISVAPDFVMLVKQEGATVVNIAALRTVHDTELDPGSPPSLSDAPPHALSGRFAPPAPHEYQARDLGCGFIVSEDGYILTNAHLMDYAEEVVVKFLDKRELKATVVGVDRRTDVALIKIDVKGLRTVHIGDPSKLEVGEWVAAIGSPFGFENSITAGIVSAKGRYLPAESYVPFIQTDVPVNPGNSGGPLFNRAGEVIGINSMIYSGSGGYMGLSFAVPIDVAMKVAGDLRAHGKVIRSRLGMQTQDLTWDLAASFGLSSATGALVVMVEKRGPAEKAGFLAGDVIVKVDGNAVENPSDVPLLVVATPPGTVVKFQVWRHGAVTELTATTDESPAERARIPEAREQRRGNRTGLVLNELAPIQREQLEIAGGVLVRNASGPALKAGIREGDVILAVNDTTVERVPEFNKLMAKVAPGNVAAVLVLRQGLRAYTSLRVTD